MNSTPKIIENKPHHHAARIARTGWRPWILFLVAGLFYFYEFFARVAPGVLKEDIVSATGTTEAGFGLATGMYFLAYAPAQLVVGRLLDRFGTRIIVAPATLLVAFGCLIFATSSNISLMGVGRFMQGLGSAVAYLGAVYLAMVWFPPRRHGIIPGLTVAIGTLGASTAQYPLAIMNQEWGWRTPMYGCFFVGIFIAVLLWIVVPRRPVWFVDLMKDDGYDPDTPEPLSKTILGIARDRQLWLISLAAAGIYLPISVVGDLWGVTFLKIETGMSIKDASLVTTLVFIGFAIGGVTIGHLSDRFQKRKGFFILAGLATSTVATALLFAQYESTALTIVLFALLGLSVGGQCLAFVMTADNSARHTRGMKLAFVNFVVMILPVAIQPGVGLISSMGLSEGQTPNAGQEIRGFALVVVLILMSTVVTFFVKETRPREDAGPGGLH